MLSIFMKKLTVNEARNKVTTSDNAVLIDCRPKEDYAHGHVAGAINFPIEKITEERVCRRLPDKTTCSGDGNDNAMDGYNNPGSR